MADLFQTGATKLAELRTAHSAHEVAYWNGTTTYAVFATRGRSTADELDDHGVPVRVASADFLIAVSEMDRVGFVGKPQIGHRITDGDSLFSVMPFGSEPCWRYSDGGEQTYRIHAKRIE